MKTLKFITAAVFVFLFSAGVFAQLATITTRVDEKCSEPDANGTSKCTYYKVQASGGYCHAIEGGACFVRYTDENGVSRDGKVAQ